MRLSQERLRPGGGTEVFLALGRLPTPASHLLRPVLDLYMDAAVAVVGCHAAGIGRPSCELDVLVIRDETLPPATVNIGGSPMDLYFINEKAALKPETPELAVSMARAMPIRDTSFVVSAGSAAAAAVFSESCKMSARERLASALKSLGRVDEALANRSFAEADFWLTSSAFDFGRAWLYSLEGIPSPSHLVRQLKESARSGRGYFEAFRAGAALEQASRSSCASRLEGVGVVHDILTRSSDARMPENSQPEEYFEVVNAKATELAIRVEHPESFSFLGQELVRQLEAVAAEGDGGKKRGKRGSQVGSLLSGKNHLLSERLQKELGLTRGEESMRISADNLRQQVSSLTKSL